MGRVEGAAARSWTGRTGDPVLDWFAEAEGERLEKAIHRLQDRPPYHPRCHCQVKVIEARGEQWEVTQTVRHSPWPCAECLAREQIWKDLAKHGHPSITVLRLAKGVEAKAFWRVYSHLQKLVEKYPMAVPEGGIKLSFDGTLISGDVGQWIEKEHRINLSGEYFSNGASFALLEFELGLAEARRQTPRGCRSVEYVINHEFGHSLRYRLNQQRYDGWWRTTNQAEICCDAETSASEAFADAFAMIQHVPEVQWPSAVAHLCEYLKGDGVR